MSEITFIMGVSGCGKSTVAAALARASGAQFLEGDDFHPPQNVAAMAAGQPLDDAMRAPWLRALGTAAREAATRGDVVISCSGLKRAYRDLLRDSAGPCMILMLHGNPALIRARITARRGHYMPPELLDSQLATLELPTPQEQGCALVDIAGEAEDVISAAADAQEGLRSGRICG